MTRDLKTRWAAALIFTVVSAILYATDHLIGSGIGFVTAMALGASTPIANRDAVPSVLNMSQLVGGFLMSSKGVFTNGATDTAGSIYRMNQIPSNAIVEEVILRCGSLGTGAAADIGLYRTMEDGGAVVDADFFASALSLAAAVAWVNQALESTVMTIQDMQTPIWQAVGLTSDPKCNFDVCLTLTGAATVSTDILLVTRYTKAA